MILITHIIIALASIASATAAFLMPSTAKIRVSYALIGLTLASGTYLVILHPAHMVSACVSGIVYVIGVTTCVAAAHRKLAEDRVSSSRS